MKSRLAESSRYRTAAAWALGVLFLAAASAARADEWELFIGYELPENKDLASDALNFVGSIGTRYDAAIQAIDPDAGAEERAASLRDFERDFRLSIASDPGITFWLAIRRRRTDGYVLPLMQLTVGEATNERIDPSFRHLKGPNVYHSTGVYASIITSRGMCTFRKLPGGGTVKFPTLRRINERGKNGSTAILAAIPTYNVRLPSYRGPTIAEEVILLSHLGASVNTQVIDGLTPLYLAAWTPHDGGRSEILDTVKFLIGKGARHDATTVLRDTPLHAAAWRGNVATARLLIGAGANVNAANRWGDTPLHMAAWPAAAGGVEMARLLVRAGANVNAKTRGDTRLHRDARRGDLDLAKKLISDPAYKSRDTRGKSGLTPLHLVAGYWGSSDMARFLIDNGADLNAKDSVGDAPLHAAFRANNSKMVRLLIDKGADINAIDRSGNTPLHSAVLKGDVEMARLLIDKGADMSPRRKHGSWPLTEASRKGHLDVVRLLIDHGASVNLPEDDLGSEPLVTAAENGHLEVVRLLVDEGANVNGKGSRDTPLHYASRNGHLNVVRLLVDKGAQVDAIRRRETPLHSALTYGRYEVARLLIDKGADVTAPGKQGRTPLQIVAASKQIGALDFAKLLVDKGADVTAKDGYGKTPLHDAASYSVLEVAKFLVAEGANARAKDNIDRTPLFYAARSGELELVKFLVEKGADVRATGKSGWTPLHAAAYRNDLDVVKFLVDEGALVSAKTKDGKTPLDLSSGDRRKAVADFLRSRGGTADEPSTGDPQAAREEPSDAAETRGQTATTTGSQNQSSEPLEDKKRTEAQSLLPIGASAAFLALGGAAILVLRRWRASSSA